jgi:hypothetical protein
MLELGEAPRQRPADPARADDADPHTQLRIPHHTEALYAHIRASRKLRRLARTTQASRST